MTTTQRGRAGTLLGGRYRLLEPLPGAGRSWRARDEIDDRLLLARAIELPDGLPEAERQEARKRALREAAVVARVQHPGVAPVVDAVVEEGAPWVISVLPPGRSLGEIVGDEGPVSPVAAALIGLQVLDALAAAGVPHGELTPYDVVIAEDGRVRVTGFATTPLGAVGTRGFGPPEGGVGPAADLWALGVTLHVAVEGRMPGGARPRAGALGSALDALLARDPQDRADPGAIRALLVEAAGEPETPAPPPLVQDVHDPEVMAALAAFDAALATRPAPHRDAAAPALRSDAAPPAATQAGGTTPVRTPPTVADAPTAPDQTPQAVTDAPAAPDQAQQSEPADHGAAPDQTPQAQTGAAPDQTPKTVTNAPTAPDHAPQNEPADHGAAPDQASHDQAQPDKTPQAETTEDARTDTASPALTPEHVAPAALIGTRHPPEPQPEATAPQPEATAPPADPPTPTPAPEADPQYAPPNGRRRLVVAGIAVVAVLAALLIPFLLTRGGDDQAPAAQPTATPQPTDTAPTLDTPIPPPAGYQLYRDPAGWSIALPVGWTIARRGTAVTFAQGDRTLRVSERANPPKDTYDAALKLQPVLQAATPGYDLIRIANVTYRTWPTTDYEFRAGTATRTHSLIRSTVPNPRQVFDFTWTCLDRTWTEDRTFFDTAVRTFDPGA
ncbi:MAG TPA: hypothetical protein VI357_02820 [Mycobacteriales bacterium]